jgi:uncharacterized protein
MAKPDGPTVRDRIFLQFAEIAIHHRKALFAVVALLTLASLATFPFLKIRTTRQGMHPHDLPEQIRYERFLDEFGTTTQLVVLLEGDTDKIMAAADDVAAALTADPSWVRNIFYKVDLAFFEKEGLYFLSEENLEVFRDGLKQYAPTVAKAMQAATLSAAFDSMTDLSEGANVDPANAGEFLDGLDDVFAGWEKHLTGESTGPFELDRDKLAKFFPMAGTEMVGKGGYLIGKDGKSLLLTVQQAQTTDDSSFITPFMKHCRAVTAEALAAHPGVTVGFTGWPVAVEEEVAMLKRDLAVVSFFSTVVIMLMLFLSFRSLTKSILVFVPLVFGVIWNTAFIYLKIGYISYFTSIFIGLLFSLGTGYGIVFMRRFREELTAGFEKNEAMRRSFVGVGPGILTSSSTTVAAFLAISFFDVPAFAEMGVVSAMGMFCLMVATMAILPPLMLVFGETIRKQAHIRVVGAGVIDWLWTKIAPRPWVLIGVALALVVGSVIILPGVSFDYDVNNLLPKESETRRVADKLEAAMGHQTQFIGLIVENLDQVRALEKVLAKTETVATVQSPASLVPENQDAKQKILAQIAAELEALPEPAPVGAPDLPGLRAKLTAMADEMASYQEAAFGEGKVELVAKLGNILTRLEGLDAALAAPEAAARQQAFTASMREAAVEVKKQLIQMARAPQVSLDTIPENLRLRFVGRKGGLAMMVFPTEAIWDPAFLEKFVTNVTAATVSVLGEHEGVERTTGFGVVYRQTSHMISSGFRQALILTFGLVALLLLIDFRRPLTALVAALPLLVAMAVTLGYMVLTGQKFNMASQLALPVLVGIGVDFGVHTVHRWLEPDGFDLNKVVRTIGGAIWLAGATNLIGFGALMLGHYRGLTGLGQVLFVGILFAFTGAIFGIPAAIIALRLDRRTSSSQN